MSIELLADHPEYGNRIAKHRLDMAEASGDELAQARLTATFEQDKSKMLTEVYANRESKQVLDAARTAASTKYPDVDPSLYADASSPADVDRIAGAIQASISKRVGGQSGEPAPAEEGAASWGGPPSGSTGAPAQAPPMTRREEMEKLHDKAMLGKKAPIENKRYRDLAVAPWLDAVEEAILQSRPHLRQGASQ